MPEFQYRAKEGPEKVVEGVIDAPTEAMAIEKISGMGLVPVFVRSRADTKDPQSRSGTASSALVSKRKINQELILFSKHLASLTKSGVPILKAIHTLSRQTRNAKFSRALESLGDHIRQGETLSQAMVRIPDIFFSMYIATVRAGESSGDLQDALARMANHLKKEEDFRSKVRRAIAYPALLGVAGFGTILFIITFVVPKLSKLFTNLGQALPMPTRVVLAVAGFMQNFWYLLLLGVAVVFFLAPYLIRKILGENYFEFLKLKTPVLGKLFFKTEFARFARTLQMSLSGGIAFLEALRVAIPTINNGVLREALEDCHTRIQKGDSFGLSLKNQPYFPGFVTDLIVIGEESGRLEEVLGEISEAYEQEVDESLVFFTTLLEPAMILIVGAFVGFIVIAMLLPIFEMNTIV